LRRCIPSHPPALPQAQVGQLRFQAVLDAERHGDGGFLARPHPMQKVLHVHICRPAKTFGGSFRQRHRFFVARPVDAAGLAADIHASEFAIEMVHLFVTALVLHRRIVEGEDTDEILRVFRRHHD
jgi:hypothetical protein